MNTYIAFAAGAYVTQALNSYANWKGIGTDAVGNAKRWSLKRAGAAAIWPLTAVFFAVVSRFGVVQ